MAWGLHIAWRKSEYENCINRSPARGRSERRMGKEVTCIPCHVQRNQSQGKLFSSQTISSPQAPYPATHCGTTSASTVPRRARADARRLHNDEPWFNRLAPFDQADALPPIESS